MAKDDRQIHRGIRMPAVRAGNKLRKGVTITDPDELEASGLDLKALQEAGVISGTWGRTKKAKAEPDTEDGDDVSFNELRARAKEAGIEGYGKMKKAELAAALETEQTAE
jgi:hypothetical protein